MTGWRLAKSRYADPPRAAFDGEGSRRRGGRLSPPGTRVAYAPSSLALAALEYFVNLDPSQAPDGPVSIEVGIPDSTKIERVDTPDLPANWREYPHPAELPLIGETWLRAGSSVCLIVPPAVIAEENNLLINLSHPDFRTLLFSQPQPFQYDARMWK